MQTEWIEWIEPFGPNSEPVYCRVLPAVAIATQRKSAMDARKYEYLTDERALEDFMDVHWAVKVILPEPEV